MESLALEWMREIYVRRKECVKTLDREKMHYESVFKIQRDGRLFLSWFSVQSDNGTKIDESSPFEIDKLHCDYWKKCIDEDYEPEDMEHIVSFVPESVEEALYKRDESLSDKQF